MPRQAYMLAALNMREAQSKQTEQKYDNVPKHHIGDLVMIKILTGSLTGIQNTFQTSE